MFETFDHTADLGLRIRAASRNELFEEAGLALFSIVVEDMQTVRPQKQVDVSLQGDDVEFLLFDWLKQLLFYFDAEHILFSRFEVHVADDGLKGRAWGESVDRQRHHLEHEVKAITYHELKVEHGDNGWFAEVIVDI